MRLRPWQGIRSSKMGGFAAIVAMLGVAALAIVAGLVTTSASAEVTTVAALNDAGAIHRNLATNRCMDSNERDPAASNPDQGDVYTLPCNNGRYQAWAPIYVMEEFLGATVRSGYVKLRNVATGKCLDSNEHDGEVSNPDQGKVYALPCHDGHNQQWRVHKLSPLADGNPHVGLDPGPVPPGYVVQNRATGKCLDSNWHDGAASNPDQGKVYTMSCNRGLHQAWQPANL